MKVEFDNVEEVTDAVVRASKNGTSGYIYLSKKLKGRHIKVIIFKE